MIFRFSRHIYPKSALLKCAYSFTDRAYIHLDQDDQYFLVDIVSKDNKEIDYLEFENEMLAQTVRYEIFQQTKTIRQLIVARSLASTVIVEPQNDCDGFETMEDYETFDIDKVLTDWFERNE